MTVEYLEIRRHVADQIGLQAAAVLEEILRATHQEHRPISLEELKLRLSCLTSAVLLATCSSLKEQGLIDEHVNGTGTRLYKLTVYGLGYALGKENYR